MAFGSDLCTCGHRWNVHFDQAGAERGCSLSDCPCQAFTKPGAPPETERTP